MAGVMLTGGCFYLPYAVLPNSMQVLALFYVYLYKYLLGGAELRANRYILTWRAWKPAVQLFSSVSVLRCLLHMLRSGWYICNRTALLNTTISHKDMFVSSECYHDHFKTHASVITGCKETLQSVHKHWNCTKDFLVTGNFLPHTHTQKHHGYHGSQKECCDVMYRDIDITPVYRPTMRKFFSSRTSELTFNPPYTLYM